MRLVIDHVHEDRTVARQTVDHKRCRKLGELADRGADERILPLALDSGVAVLVNRPFGNGNLFSAVGDRPLPGWAAEIDASSWGQVFLKYIISHPAATIPIPGTSKPHHAVDNMAAASGRLPGAELRQEMERFMDKLL